MDYKEEKYILLNEINKKNKTIEAQGRKIQDLNELIKSLEAYIYNTYKQNDENLTVYQLAVNMKDAMTGDEWTPVVDCDYLQHRKINITKPSMDSDGVYLYTSPIGNRDDIKYDINDEVSVKKALCEYFNSIDGYRGLFKELEIQELFVSICINDYDKFYLYWHLPTTKELIETILKLRPEF